MERTKIQKDVETFVYNGSFRSSVKPYSIHGGLEIKFIPEQRSATIRISHEGDYDRGRIYETQIDLPEINPVSGLAFENLSFQMPKKLGNNEYETLTVQFYCTKKGELMCSYNSNKTPYDEGTAKLYEIEN